MTLHWNPDLFNWQAPGGNPPSNRARSVLKSTIAGTWYPGDAPALRHEIKSMLDRAAAEAAERTAGSDCNVFTVPHAGYAYSGVCAAHAYRHFTGRALKRVILLAPSHRIYLKDQLILPEADALSTPLGETVVDTHLRGMLLKLSGASANDKIHEYEHSTQIQLPFLQTVMEEGFTILPVIMGSISAATAEKFGNFLAGALSRPDTVLVVSSDFTHYGRDFGYTPFASDRLLNVRRVDMGAFHYIQTGDAATFREYTEKKNCTICGAYPIYAMLNIPYRSQETTLFRYCTSADDGASGDDRFVCYLACGLKMTFEQLNEVLSIEDKRILLNMARRSIEYRFANGRPPADTKFAEEATESMKQKMGAFVTLHSPDGSLRGCIGEIEPRRPLYEAVTGRACDSAFRDPRFMPLRPQELAGVRIEISALTPSKPIENWQDIEIGRHGMTVTKHGRSAVFLPQVAPEQGWTLEQTLRQLCLKAGLGPDDFRTGASFTVFEAVVFSEDTVG